uniref:Uncharacterized protein n=2 Tax=Oryza sativa subsp. japonica TaxID=39947 RepID=Q6Z187_ORYSJ|nr:hypothetical protein [Oryza sativa Japonica Group]BAD02992.1 hypothetical protein [Oryza sativa Japonica Group]BAD03605.1 hypothetical protein [Oryza sativa Japonica Group]
MATARWTEEAQWIATAPFFFPSPPRVRAVGWPGAKAATNVAVDEGGDAGDGRGSGGGRDDDGGDRDDDGGDRDGDEEGGDDGDGDDDGGAAERSTVAVRRS